MSHKRTTHNRKGHLYCLYTASNLRNTNTKKYRPTSYTLEEGGSRTLFGEGWLGAFAVRPSESQHASAHALRAGAVAVGWRPAVERRQALVLAPLVGEADAAYPGVHVIAPWAHELRVGVRMVLCQRGHATIGR